MAFINKFIKRYGNRARNHTKICMPIDAESVPALQSLFLRSLGIIVLYIYMDAFFLCKSHTLYRFTFFGHEPDVLKLMRVLLRDVLGPGRIGLGFGYLQGDSAQSCQACL
jgi:hypothetical protein